MYETIRYSQSSFKTYYLLSKLYQAFLLPILDYCDTVWAATSTAISKPLERLHCHFLRNLSVSSSFVKLTLIERRGFHIASCAGV